MDPEAPRFAALLGGQRDLGVGLLAELPGGFQALEGGAELDSGLGDEVIEGPDLQRLGPGRRPDVDVEAGESGVGGAEGAAGVADPGLLALPTSGRE